MFVSSKQRQIFWSHKDFDTKEHQLVALNFITSVIRHTRAHECNHKGYEENDLNFRWMDSNLIESAYKNTANRGDMLEFRTKHSIV
jgi:hypothetical protein